MTEGRGESLSRFDDAVGRIIMHLRVPTAKALLVEGESDEYVLAKNRPRGVHIFISKTRAQVLACVESLRANGAQRVLGLIDRDFEEGDAQANVFYYDGCDLEATLISLGVLQDILENSGSPGKIARVGGVHAAVDEVVACAKAVGAIRRINAIEGLGLNFKDVDLAKYVDKVNLSFDRAGFVRAAIRASEGPAGNAEERAIRVTEHESENYRGRDCLIIAGVALRRRFANLNHQAVSPSILENSLHLAGRQILWSSDWGKRLEEELASV